MVEFEIIPVEPIRGQIFGGMAAEVRRLLDEGTRLG